MIAAKLPVGFGEVAVNELGVGACRDAAEMRDSGRIGTDFACAKAAWGLVRDTTTPFGALDSESSSRRILFGFRESVRTVTSPTVARMLPALMTKAFAGAPTAPMGCPTEGEVIKAAR